MTLHEPGPQPGIDVEEASDPGPAAVADLAVPEEQEAAGVLLHVPDFGQAPNPARVREHWLGGRDSYGPDREAAEEIAAAAPWMREVVRLQLEFLRGAVWSAVAEGMRQFLYLGCGMPGDAVSSVTDLVPDEAVMAYVEQDPVALVHARALLMVSDRRIVLDGSAADLEPLLEDLQQGGRIDLDRPVGVLVADVLEHLDDDAALRFLTQLRNRLAAGSTAAITQLVPGHDERQANEVTAAADLYGRLVGLLVVRSGAALTALTTGWELPPDGLVQPKPWPDEPWSDRAPSEHLPIVAGVLQVPAATTSARAEQT